MDRNCDAFIRSNNTYDILIVRESLEISDDRAECIQNIGEKFVAEYFDRADVDGAKAYFLQAKKERPDLLMEASDITGELHLCMEVIAIAGLEQQAYGKNLLTRVRGFRNLMQYCNNLNRYVLQKKQEIPDAGLQEWEEENEVTPVARQVAEQVMHASEAEASVVHRLQNQLAK